MYSIKWLICKIFFSNHVIIFQANFNPSFPLLVLGVMGIIGGILTLFLPETMDQELPQTLQDGEEFGKDQKFFDFPCVKR